MKLPPVLLVLAVKATREVPLQVPIVCLSAVVAVGVVQVLLVKMGPSRVACMSAVMAAMVWPVLLPELRLFMQVVAAVVVALLLAQEAMGEVGTQARRELMARMA